VRERPVPRRRRGRPVDAPGTAACWLSSRFPRTPE